MPQPRILAFAGTTRTDALNKKLVKVAAESAREAGGEVTLIDLRDFPMPLYDGDLEAREGIPAEGKRFKRLLVDHAGFLISTGEYNSSITGVLKNAIDWASREEAGEKPLAAYRDKVVALMAASPGQLGGLRAIVHVRSILGNIGCIVLPQQFALSRAGEAFGPDGALKDPKQRAAVDKVAQPLVAILKKLNV